MRKNAADFCQKLSFSTPWNNPEPLGCFWFGWSARQNLLTRANIWLYICTPISFFASNGVSCTADITLRISFFPVVSSSFITQFLAFVISQKGLWFSRIAFLLSVFFPCSLYCSSRSAVQYFSFTQNPHFFSARVFFLCMYIFNFPRWAHTICFAGSFATLLL